MTVTIYTVINSLLWSCLFSIILFCLSHSKRFLRRFGITPLFILSSICILKCAFIVEFTSTKEIGAPKLLNKISVFLNSTSGKCSMKLLLFRLWLVGSILLLILYLLLICYQGWIVHRLPPAMDRRISKIFQERRISQPRVVITSLVDIPCVVGIWRETILLPDHRYTLRQLRLVLLHEYAHIHHHDGAMDFVLHLVCIALWWNPAVHVCRVCITDICDYRCDLDVIGTDDAKSKRLYCRTLLDFATGTHGFGRKLARPALKNRFNLILGVQNRHSGLSTLLTALMALSIMIFSYLVVLQPVFQPEDADYKNHQLDSETLIETPDGSYRLLTEDGEVIIPAEEAEIMLADGFQIKSGG